MIDHLGSGQLRLSNRTQGHAIAGYAACHVQSRSAIAGGYVFESALTFVESQSPLLRPADTCPDRADADVADCEARELASRVTMLTTLLDGVRGQVASEEALLLLEAAGRVADELVARFGPGAERVSINPSVPCEQRRAATMALMGVWSLQDAIIFYPLTRGGTAE
jgi:hypothetical protein